MKRLGLRSAIRVKSVRTTASDGNTPRLLEDVRRHFKTDRSSKLWVADFTYLPIWHSYDNVLAETINSLFEAEVIHRQISCRLREDIEGAAPQRPEWFNNRLLMEGAAREHPTGEVGAAYGYQAPECAIEASPTLTSFREALGFQYRPACILCLTLV